MATPAKAAPTQAASTQAAAARAVVRRACTCSATSGGCGCAGKKVRRSPDGSGAPEAAPPIVGDVLRAGGAPLAPEVRGFFEQRMGHDFGRVRIHTGDRAAQSARAVGAQAYTVGAHIVFGTSRYAPEAGTGRRLLAHELAHTIQQRDVDATVQRAPELPIGDAGDPLEHEADRLAERALAGLPPSPVAGAAPGLQRVPSTGCPPAPTGLGDTAPPESCSPAAYSIRGELFEYCFDTATPKPAEVPRFRDPTFLAALRRRTVVDVHGLASPEGPAGRATAYNLSLACHRAADAKRRLIAAGIPGSSIRIHTHGGTTTMGSVDRNRAVVIPTAPEPVVSPPPTPAPPVPQPVEPQLPRCGPDVTDWFVRKVNDATTDPDVLSIQTNNARADVVARTVGASAAAFQETGAAAAVMAQWSLLAARGLAPPFDATIARQLASASATGAPAVTATTRGGLSSVAAGVAAGFVAAAALGWRALVNHGARYDFKRHVMYRPSAGGCPDPGCPPGEVGTVTLCPGSGVNCFDSDRPGNIFYALIGRFAGFSENTLQLGSQLAELTDLPRPGRPRVIWDTPDDTAAIHLGFLLPLPLTAATLCAAIARSRGSLGASMGCAECSVRFPP